MNVRRPVTASILLLCLGLTVQALPVKLGEVEIGLESYDGYQEGMAYLSMDEKGEGLEILIGYKGFGLDTVTWTMGSEDLTAFADAALQAAWWRSRLLEMTVDQTVLKEVTKLDPSLIYTYRSSNFPFESAEHILNFERQGRDYALVMSEDAAGADTRKSGDKTLPILIMHFSGRELPELRDMLTEENRTAVLTAYLEKKAAIQKILENGPSQTDEGM